jgi:hypothetical protein
MDVKKRIAEITELKLAAPTKENKPVDVLDANEIVSARTATAKVYGLGGGLRRAIVRGVPVHFQDPATGLYLPIDMAVKRKPLLADTSHGTYETVSGLYKAHFPEARPWNYRLEMGDSWVQYEAQFEESEHLDIDVETTRTGIKETITLYDDQAPTRLVWNVSKSGLGITIMPPTAVDARGKDVPVTVTEGKGTLTYDVDVTGVTWPVVIDPTSTVYATNDKAIMSQSFSNYMTARDATSGISPKDGIIIGQDYTDGSGWVQSRSFLSFAISSNIEVVDEITLGMYLSGDYSTTDFYIRLVSSTYSNPAVAGDFDLVDGWASSAPYTGTILNTPWHTATIAAGYNTTVFNYSGRSLVTSLINSTLKIAALSSRDYSNTAPTKNVAERVEFYNSSYSVTSRDPYLSIVYSAAAAAGGRRPRARYHGV